MSRGQESQAFNTASGDNAGFYNNAQTSYGDAQADIGNYDQALGQFAAANPYTPNGQFAQDQTQILANTSDASSSSMKAALQDQAKRTGQNMGAANATAESIAEANERNLSGQEAQADKERTAADATYGEQVLNATAKPAELEAGLYGASANAANGALGNEVNAGKTPGFWDSLMQDGSNVAAGAARNI
jgi:hypothetical protein